MIFTTGLIIFGLAIISVIIWIFLFKPLFSQVSQLSVNIREELLEGMQTSYTSLTSLSASAIVLTFSVLELLGDKPIQNTPIIIATWISFLLCVLLGMGIGISSYVERAVSKVMVNNFVKAENQNTEQGSVEESVVKDVTFTQKKQFQLLKLRVLLLFCQSVAFSSGIILMTIFAILNLSHIAKV